jgi:hypothetical protein
MATKAQLTEQEEFRAKLRACLKPGDTLHTAVKHVSSSGMTRIINVYQLHEGDADWLSYWVAKATGIPFDDKRDALRVGGCGMDMGFHVVYELGRVLWPNGYECPGVKCHSNDHFNGDRDYTPGHTTHRDGGYALYQRWL